jgi:hypothetical protein
MRVVIGIPVKDRVRPTELYVGKNISPGIFAVMVSRAVDVPSSAFSSGVTWNIAVLH